MGYKRRWQRLKTKLDWVSKVKLSTKPISSRKKYPKDWEMRHVCDQMTDYMKMHAGVVKQTEQQKWHCKHHRVSKEWKMTNTKKNKST